MGDNDTISSSSEDSLGSEEEEMEANSGSQLVGSDSLLDSSDSSDSDSLKDVENEEMDVDEDALMADLQRINDQLAENPYSYELYGEKINILKKLGDLEKLRQTREKFSELYPLSEALWLDWIRDEIKLACTDEEKDEVKKLLDRAVQDYLSIDIWLEYINFCISRMDSENGPSNCREIFERALGTCGLHVSMGSVIWDMYRDFETALLGTTKTEEELQTQENRFIALCRRQLSVPLLGMSDIYESMKSKIDIDENTESGYRKALQRLKTLEKWEGKLVQQTGNDKTGIYREYIEDEKKAKSNPARIQCLYERAVAEYPLDSSLWLDYLEYVSKNLKIDTIALDVSLRASRNCSWDVNVWLKYMNIVELFCVSEKFETMRTVLEKALLYCGTGEQAGTVWLKYLEFLRRKFDFSETSEETKELEILRKSFDTAEQHLLQLVQEPNEYISEILLFRVRFEAKYAKGIKEDVANMWKDILKRGYGMYSKTWLQYILQETLFGGDIRKLRLHYSRALQYVQDDIQTLSNLWINFERDNGDLSTLKQCEQKIATQLSKMSSTVETQQDQTEGAVSVSDRSKQFNTNAIKGQKRKLEDDSVGVVVKKEKKSEDTVDHDNSVFKMPAVPTPKKKAAPENNSSGHGVSVKHDSSKDNRTVFLSNLAFTTQEDEIRSIFNDCGHVEEVRLAKDFKGRSKGFGYAFFSSQENAKLALGKDRELINGRPVFVSRCDPDKSTRQKQFKYPTNLEKNKLFVKGLPFSLTADELRDMFKVHGDLKDCRLVTYRNGHSKGLAFIEFIDEASASQAIMKTDGMTIGDQKISVAISNPPRKEVTRPSSYSKKSTDTLQRRTPKVFVPRSLQLSSTKKEENGSSNSTNTAPKSNQDFRNLFLK